MASFPRNIPTPQTYVSFPLPSETVDSSDGSITRFFKSHLPFGKNTSTPLRDLKLPLLSSPPLSTSSESSSTSSSGQEFYSDSSGSTEMAPINYSLYVEAVPTTTITPITITEPASEIKAPTTLMGRIKSCASTVFGVAKKIATHPVTVTALALGSIATAAVGGAYLQSTPAMVAGCVGAGFFTKQVIEHVPLAKRLTDRFLGYWGYECVIGTNYTFYYHPVAGLILGGILAGASVRELINKASTKLEQRNIPQSEVEQFQALIEQGLELERHPEAHTRTEATINFLKRHWKTLVVLAFGAALFPARSPAVLEKVLSVIPETLEMSALYTYTVVIDAGVFIFGAVAGYHCERKTHEWRLDFQNSSKIKSLATKAINFLTGAGHPLVFAAGMTLYNNYNVAWIFASGITLVGFAMGANASERARRNTLKEKKLTIIDLETGTELPQLTKDDLACIEKGQCIQKVRNKWDGSSKVRKFIRENAGTLFCTAGLIALTSVYHIEGFAFDESLQTTGMLVGSLVGFYAERWASHRWTNEFQSNQNPTLNRIQKAIKHSIENYQLEMLFAGVYAAANGWPIGFPICASILGFSVGSNRSHVNAGGRNLHPGAGFVSYKVLSNALTFQFH